MLTKGRTCGQCCTPTAVLLLWSLQANSYVADVKLRPPKSCSSQVFSGSTPTAVCKRKPPKRI